MIKTLKLTTNAMKTIYTSAIVLLILSAMTGCEDMNSLHQKYLDAGPRVYLGKPDSVTVKPGYNCLRIVWTNNADSKIQKTRIVYNYGNDTLFVPFERKTPGFQRDSVTLDLEPGDYIFELCNMSEDEELQSIPVTGIIGKVYGESYKAQLATRSFETSIDQNTVTINWGDITSDYLYSIVRYTDRSGDTPVEKMKTCGNNSYTTIIENVQDGDVITVTSAYKPESNYMDVIESIPVTARFVQKNGQVDSKPFVRCTDIPFDNTTDHATWAQFWTLFDTKPTDAWLTSIPDENSQNNHQFPISFTIDLGASIELDRLVMFMVTGWEYQNSSPKRFDVWGTDMIAKDKPYEYWSTTDLGGWSLDWEKLASCETLQPSGGGIGSITEEDIAYAQKGFSFSINPKKTKIRYVRILIYETWDGSINTGIGELVFYGNMLMRE